MLANMLPILFTWVLFPAKAYGSSGEPKVEGAIDAILRQLSETAPVISAGSVPYAVKNEVSEATCSTYVTQCNPVYFSERHFILETFNVTYGAKCQVDSGLTVDRRRRRDRRGSVPFDFDTNIHYGGEIGFEYGEQYTKSTAAWTRSTNILVNYIFVNYIFVNYIFVNYIFVDYIFIDHIFVNYIFVDHFLINYIFVNYIFVDHFLVDHFHTIAITTATSGRNHPNLLTLKPSGVKT
ncbi:hypothetical protein NLG97_g8830 [Lecanicillium saksenae]|uniref:Uncharacterized protein n=1 Tax=Lecanicillium saksenae TaxID=468837 RepID=A0ACC1QIA0_9HYPO|nr:hypothetical protein NLG97_g8830 [Lecanicillium saksenae]